MTGRSPACRTTTGCGRTGNPRRQSNERRRPTHARGRDPAIRQTTLPADIGWAVCAVGRAGGEGTTIASELFGSAAGRGGGRTRTQGDGAAGAGGALPRGEDAGGVRLPMCVPPSGAAATESE